MFSSLKNRDYRLYWTGAMVSFTGSWVQTICHGWLVYEITGSRFWLGLIGFIGAAPLFGLSFIGGAIADKVDKRRFLIVTQFLFGVFAVLLGVLVAKHAVSKYNIAAIAFCTGIVAAMDAPMRQSIPIEIVGKKDLANAIALNSVAFNFARIFGPALAALLVKQIGMSWCFYANAISYAAVIAALVFMHVKTPPANEDGESVFSDLRAGFSYIRSERTIAVLIIMTVVPSLFVMPYGSLVLIMSKDILKAGITGYSSLMMATGIGASIGALVLAITAKSEKRGLRLLIAAVFDSFMLLLVAASRDIHLTRFAMMGVGFMTVNFNAMMNTLLQSLSSDRFRGRVMSAYVFAMMGLSPFASLQAGTVAQLWGAPVALTLGGLLFAAMAIFIYLTRRDVREL